MALSTALMLAPPALKLGARALGIKSRPSNFEKSLLRMADIFEQDATAPLTENREYKTGKAALDERDRLNRRRINNRSAITGGTNEAKIATMDSSNRSYSNALNQLLNFASRFRDRSQNRYMNTLSAAEAARQGRVGQFNAQMNSIMDPIGEAGRAFAMADVFGKDDDKKDAPESEQIDAPDAFYYGMKNQFNWLNPTAGSFG